MANSKAEELIKEKLMNAIEPPISLSERQVELAKKFVQAKMLGVSNQDFCDDNRISTKTLYQWKEEDAFNNYLNELQNAIIPEDEKLAFQQLKKHLLKIPYMQNPTPKQIDMFLSVFSYVQEQDKIQRMEAMGISKDGSKSSTAKSIEQKKHSLIARLTKPNNSKGEMENE